jgi:hypothetical protein
VTRTLIYDTSQLITCRQDSASPKIGEDFRRLELIEHGAMVVNDVRIEWVGAEVPRPLATVVNGGIVTATALTLLALPVLYSIFGSRSKTED